MAALCLPTLRTISYIAGKYALRRKVTDASTGIPRPIISFSTQYIPVMTAIADAFVSIALVNSVHAAFRDPELGSTAKHFLAAVSKVTAFNHALKDLMVLGDRCGAQGLLQVNQLEPLIVRIAPHLVFKLLSNWVFFVQNDLRGSGIAEGDIVGISIRFAIDLVLGRVSPPPSNNPDSRLACHEVAIISQVRSHIQGSRSGGEIELSPNASGRSDHSTALRSSHPGNRSPHGV